MLCHSGKQPIVIESIIVVEDEESAAAPDGLGHLTAFALHDSLQMLLRVHDKAEFLNWEINLLLTLHASR